MSINEAPTPGELLAWVEQMRSEIAENFKYEDSDMTTSADVVLNEVGRWVEDGWPSFTPVPPGPETALVAYCKPPYSAAIHRPGDCGCRGWDADYSKDPKYGVTAHPIRAADRLKVRELVAAVEGVWFAGCLDSWGHLATLNGLAITVDDD